MRYVVGPVDEIPPGTVKIVHPEPGGAGIGVFNVGGEFHALRNICPHMGAPLCQGLIRGTAEASVRPDGSHEIEWVRDGEIVACPWHGWEFEIKTGRTVFMSRSRVKHYDVSLEQPEAVAGLLAGATTVPVDVEGMTIVLEL